MSSPALVLSSNSPRRRELLAIGGWSFRIFSADVDESLLPGEGPAAYVLRLAENKARACAAAAHDRSLIVAADTIVVDGEIILGKPGDAQEAVEMLERLRGRSHQVFTGIAVFDPTSGNLLTDLCVSDVPMRAYRHEEIERYVASGDPLDKAGAYAIQHPGFQPVEKFTGCFASVMGLPLCHLARTLQHLHIPPGGNIPAGCRSELKYDCPISKAVLRGDQIG
jgi:MAF protein